MPPTRRYNQPWYTSLTLDVLVKLINNTILHPFICWLIPLCLRAGEVPWTEEVMINTIGWAIFITLVTIAIQIGNRMAYGPARTVDDEDEVIVITGGSSGLGRCIAETYAMKGASVAVIDKKGADHDAAVENVVYYRCDVSDRIALARCWKEINKDLGTPTILINNAGIVQGKSLLNLSAEEVNDTFQTNILAHYHLNQLFISALKDRPTGGTLVTISSVLGKLGAAQLSDYSATKAGLIAMHESLAAEVASYPLIKTILVAPGQLSTEMFSDLRQGPIAHFFGPIVEVSELAIQIVKMINEGEGGFIAQPFYARWVGLLDLCPAGVRKLVRRMTKIDTAMENFCVRAHGEDSSEESVELL